MTTADGPPGSTTHSVDRIRKFQRVSELLLDWHPLPSDAAKAYLDIVLAVTPAQYAPGDIYEPEHRKPQRDMHPLDVLFTVLEQLEQDGTDALANRFYAVLAADVTLNTLAKNIIIVWYNGFINYHLPPPDIYPAALVWQVIGANPPGIPGPYYGHWAYPPAQPVQPPTSL